MIASEEPWVLVPVVSPGAWKSSASIRMQRCWISKVWGYSAWSMKLRWRFCVDHQPRLGLHPGGDEGGQVALRDALHGELLLDQAHRGDRRHRVLRDRVVGGTLCYPRAHRMESIPCEVHSILLISARTIWRCPD